MEQKFALLVGFLRLVDDPKAKDSNVLQRLNAITKHGPLSASELLLQSEIVAILKPFEKAPDDFQSGEETIGNVIPLYLELLNMLTLTVKDRTGVSIPNPHSSLGLLVKRSKIFVQTLLESLERRFSLYYSIRITSWVIVVHLNSFC